MSLEYDLFKGREILVGRLEAFGFIREGSVYRYRRDFYTGLTAVLTVEEGGELSGRVLDRDFGEEYVNFRLEGASGAYVVGVRNAYVALLEEVRDAVTRRVLFTTPQARRIAAYIASEYGVFPEFLWERYPFYGVFRNPTSGKWFGIIMDLDKSKVTSREEGPTDVMNLKLDARVDEYIQKGAFPSFHMSQKSWVSLILDDRLSDEALLEMIRISYENTNKKVRRSRTSDKKQALQT